MPVLSASPLNQSRRAVLGESANPRRGWSLAAFLMLSNTTNVSASPGAGISSRRLCDTWTGSQQQGSSWTCGEERNALRPSPAPGGDTHPWRCQPPTLFSASHHRPSSPQATNACSPRVTGASSMRASSAFSASHKRRLSISAPRRPRCYGHNRPAPSFDDRAVCEALSRLPRALIGRAAFNFDHYPGWKGNHDLVLATYKTPG